MASEDFSDRFVSEVPAKARPTEVIYVQEGIPNYDVVSPFTGRTEFEEPEDFTEFVAWAERCRNELSEYWDPGHIWPHLETEGSGEDVIYVFRIGVRETCSMHLLVGVFFVNNVGKLLVKFHAEDDGKSVRIPRRELEPHWYDIEDVYVEEEALTVHTQDTTE